MSEKKLSEEPGPVSKELWRCVVMHALGSPDNSPSEPEEWSALMRQVAALERENAELRETNKALNRRCQAAESAVAEKLAAPSGSLGRALANAGYGMVQRENAKLKEHLRDFGMRWATHYVCAYCKHYGFDSPIDDTGLICRYCDCPDHGDERLGPSNMREIQAEAKAAIRKALADEPSAEGRE